MMLDKILYILRGCPGSGKSTIAEDLAKLFNIEIDVICCADDYHINENGIYEWKIENLKLSHKLCFDKCMRLMDSNTRRIIISNTNCTEKEINPYIKLGEDYGYTIFSLIVENRHNNDSIHSIDSRTLNRMESKLRNSIKLI